jgi:hypothetical protein
MSMLPKALTGLAAVAFVLAVISIFTGPIMGLAPHTFSRTCEDLALIAVALVLTGDRAAATAK